MVENVTYGVEIECCLPRSRRMRVGGYHAGVQVRGLPLGWTAQRDGSIHYGGDQRGVEFVSPILRGVDGLRQIQKVLAKLNEWGAVVNPSCGFHVHVGFCLATYGAPALQRLVHLVANYEVALYASAGTVRREANSYCTSIREAFRRLNFAETRPENMGYEAMNRYHSLNLANLWSKKTVEFRAFEGTLSFDDIAAYVRVCLGLVERAVTDNRPTAWDSKVVPAAGHKGRRQVVRMLYQLGWVKGRTERAYGALGANEPDLPTLAKSKKVLRTRAKQYDADALGTGRGA